MLDDMNMSQMTFQNLLLMGFDPGEALARYGVDITPATLLETSGVQRHMEVVMHFIILKCFPEVGQGMKLHWPIVEKVQARDFRKLVMDKLIILQKDHEIPPNPVVRSTFMDSAGGSKFLSVLFHTTQAAMRRGLEQMKQPPAISLAAYNEKDGPSLHRLARLHVSVQRKRFLSRLAEITAAHDKWRDFGDRALEVYELEAQRRKSVKGDMDSLMAGPHANVLWAVAEIARQETAIEDVGQVWKQVEGHVSHVAGQIGAAEEVLLNEGGRPCIDVRRLKGGSKTIQKERAELEALLQGWAAYISQLHNKLTHSEEGHESLLRFAAEAGGVKCAEEVGKEQLHRLRALRQELESQVAQTQGAISDLMAKHRGLSQRAPVTPTRHHGTGSGSVGLIPPTPGGALELTGSPSASASAASPAGRYFRDALKVEEVKVKVRASARGQEAAGDNRVDSDQLNLSSASPPSKAWKPSVAASLSSQKFGFPTTQAAGGYAHAAGIGVKTTTFSKDESADALADRECLQMLESPAISQGRCKVESPSKIAWSEEPLDAEGFSGQASSHISLCGAMSPVDASRSGAGSLPGFKSKEADEEGDETVSELRRRMQSLRRKLENTKASPPRPADIGIEGVKVASPVLPCVGDEDRAAKAGMAELSPGEGAGGKNSPMDRRNEDLADVIASEALGNSPSGRCIPSFHQPTKVTAGHGATQVEAWGDLTADSASTIRASAYRPTPLIGVGDGKSASAIDSRRAALRAKLEAAKHDSICPPSITSHSSTWRADDLVAGSLSVSPPKLAGKGFAVDDDPSAL